ncbi:MAG: TonB-dependent receptor plug domain-containing protein [Candidatus Cloacimonetes bacterium]|nr:TonB-dependent receptor plug domain-containing protein [Candidatus Cloacimonadota bacterium]
MKKLFLIGMGIFPMLIFSIQSRPDSLKQYHLHPVRVIADGPQASIGSVSTILKPPNTASISEAIKLSPGLNISYGSRDESNLKIRGFRKNESLILMDGRPLNSGYFGNVDLSKILADDIAEIRIIKGPASALYGTSTMGGVVNIISKNEDHILSLENKLSRNLVNSQRISSAQSWGDFRYKISLIRDERLPYPLSDNFIPTHFENGKLRDHSYQESWHADIGTQWLLNDLHELGLNTGFSLIPYKEIPSSIYAWDYGVYKDWFRSNAAIAFDYFASMNTNLRGQIYFDAAGDTFERYRDAAHQNLELSSRMESVNIGISPVLELRGAGTLNTGTRIEFRRVNRKDNNNYTEWTPNHAIVGNVFSQYESSLGNNFSFTASLGAAFYGHSKTDKIFLYPEPSAALTWHHNEHNSTILSAGINSSVPTMRQLFSAENGNPDLLASSANKIELNHKRSFSINTILDFSIFFNDVRNLIDRWNNRYENIYKVQSFGGELALNSCITKMWDTTAQYSLLQTEGDYKSSDSAPHSIEFINHFKLPWKITLHAITTWKSERDSQDSIANFHKLPAYFYHEIGISKNWDKLELSLLLHNITDEDFQTEYGYPAPGRDYTFRIKYYLK